MVDDGEPVGRARPVDLVRIADPARLRDIWSRQIRKRVRTTSLRYFELSHDPLEWAHFEWWLEHLTEHASSEIAAGTYRASPAEVIRSAKGSGLTRPLAGLAVIDTLVLRSIVRAVEPQIVAATRPWTSAPDDDTDDDDDPESDWFHLWLVKDAERRAVIEENDYVVVTDVANFYPYVSLARLEDALRSETTLEDRCTALLLQILRDVSPLFDYRPSPAGGIPQENYRCGEILAHLYLRPIDDTFAPEGSLGHYWRHSDDVVISVTTKPEGERSVHKFQKALEPLGLYPASSKTRVLRSSDYIVEQYLSLIDRVAQLRQEYIDEGETSHVAVSNLISEHLGQQARGSGWLRPMRRLLTLARMTANPCLVDSWPDVVASFPGTSRWIAEYLTAFELSERQAERVFQEIARWEPICDDVPLILLELLGLVPNQDGHETRHTIAAKTMALAISNVASRPRLAATAIVPFGKFATPDHLADLSGFMATHAPAGSVVVDQCAPLFLATDNWTLDEIGGLLASKAASGSGHRQFLQALAAGEYDAVRAALGVVQPVSREEGRWRVMRPRSLFLVPILDRAGGSGWDAARSSISEQVRSNPTLRRDLAAERWLDGGIGSDRSEPF